MDDLIRNGTLNPNYLTRPQAARFLRMNAPALAQADHRGVGPQHIKFAGRVYYLRADLATYQRNHR